MNSYLFLTALNRIYYKHFFFLLCVADVFSMFAQKQMKQAENGQQQAWDKITENCILPVSTVLYSVCTHRAKKYPADHSLAYDTIDIFSRDLDVSFNLRNNGQWKFYLRKIAQAFVDDAGGFCNHNVLNSYEGFQGLKRLWLNRQDHLLYEMQVKIQREIDYEIEFYQKRSFYKNYLDSDLEVMSAESVVAQFRYVWDRTEIRNNSVTILKMIHDSWDMMPALENGILDELFDLYVKEELNQRHIVPYTKEQIDNMDSEKLEKLFPSIHDYAKGSHVRVISTKGSLFAPTIQAVLQIFFGLSSVTVD